MNFPELKYFSWQDFLCKCGKEHTIQEYPMEFIGFVEWVDAVLRPACTFPFYISSGWRCPEHPIEAKKLMPGPHQIAALDIVCSHKNATTILGCSYLYNDITGRGISQRGNVDRRFIHIDPLEATVYRPRPHVWSY